MLARSRWKRPLAALIAGMLLAGLPFAVFAQSSATVSTVKNTTYGSVLVGPNGHALYISSKDTPNTSNCQTGICATNWPALTVAAGVTPTAGTGVTGKLGVITWSNGTRQVTYNQMPLYYWKDDTTAGQVTGNGVGPFTVALVSGMAPTPTPTATATPSATATATSTPMASSTPMAGATPAPTPAAAGNGGLFASHSTPVVAIVLLALVAGTMVFGGRELARRRVPHDR